MTLTWLAADLRAAGLDVRETDGWQTRAIPGPFEPLGVLIHHTGTTMLVRDAPSLAVCRDGRSDLTGPLCQILIGRSGSVWIIAGGRANHAGDGGGLAPTIPTNYGNRLLVGIELENTGSEPWPAHQVEVAQIATAVILRRLGPINLPRVWSHREYTRRPDGTSRKPDPAGIDMTQYRAAVADILNPPPVQEDDMPGLHQLGAAMLTVQQLYVIHRGEYPSMTENRAWSKDIEAKLARGEDLDPTYRWIADTLDAEKKPAAR